MRQRRRRRSEWRRTARTDHWRHLPVTGGPAPVEPITTGDLSDGIVVRTQLLGRVLGMRLLRVDGTVLVAPARAVGTGAATVTAAHRAGNSAGNSAGNAPQPGASHAPGTRLAEAARLLDDLR